MLVLVVTSVAPLLGPGIPLASGGSELNFMYTVPIFPSSDLVQHENASMLAVRLSEVLGISRIVPEKTILNPPITECCFADWRNHTVPLQNETSVLVFTETGTSIWLRYSGTGQLASAKVTGLFGDQLLGGDEVAISDGLEKIAGSLGLSSELRAEVSWAGRSTILLNDTTTEVPSVTAVTYGFLGGEPVAFGKELRVTFSMSHLVAVELEVFPWFTADLPAISDEDAFSAALDYLNRSQLGLESFKAGSVYLAFSAESYAPVFQVEASYGGSSIREFRVWVNAYSGEVDYAAEMGPHPSIPRPSGPWTALLGLVLIPITLILALTRLFEPIRFALLSLYVAPKIQRRKEDPLDHFIRGQIYAYVALNPGASYSEIRDAFSLKNGTTTHHLVVLERLAFITSLNDGKYKRFLPIEMKHRRLGRKLTGLQRRVLEEASQHASVGPSEVSRATGVSRQRAAYNLHKLVHWGLMEPDARHPGKYVVVPSNSGRAGDLGSASLD